MSTLPVNTFSDDLMNSIGIMSLISTAATIASIAYAKSLSRRQRLRRSIRSVNYHITRQCNYDCRFCFHTNISSKDVTLEEAKRGLKMLADEGMEKVNFAGGEPLLKSAFVGELCKYCKVDLKIGTVSIVTNGSLLTRKWLEKYGAYLDIMAVSCDSADSETNREIGRHDKAGKAPEQVSILRNAAMLCKEFNVKFKMNTVVCKYNVAQDMNALISELQPVRWKVFQVLAIEGENIGDNNTGRNVSDMLITADEYNAYLRRHSHQPSLVAESNAVMRNSYFLIDEKMRILDNGDGRKRATRSILEAGLLAAFEDNVTFDERAFDTRDGRFYKTDPVDIEDLAL